MLIFTGGNYQYAALIVTHGSKSINLINNVVKNAYVGISIGDTLSNSVDLYVKFLWREFRLISIFKCLFALEGKGKILGLFSEIKMAFYLKTPELQCYFFCQCFSLKVSKASSKSDTKTMR